MNYECSKCGWRIKGVKEAIKKCPSCGSRVNKTN